MKTDSSNAFLKVRDEAKGTPQLGTVVTLAISSLGTAGMKKILGDETKLSLYGRTVKYNIVKLICF